MFRFWMLRLCTALSHLSNEIQVALCTHFIDRFPAFQSRERFVLSQFIPLLRKSSDHETFLACKYRISTMHLMISPLRFMLSISSTTTKHVFVSANQPSLRLRTAFQPCQFTRSRLCAITNCRNPPLSLRRFSIAHCQGFPYQRFPVNQLTTQRVPLLASQLQGGPRFPQAFDRKICFLKSSNGFVASMFEPTSIIG